MEAPSGAEGSPGCLPVKGPSAMWTEAAEPQSRVTERVHRGGGCCEREIEKKKEPGSPQGSDRRHQRLRLRLSLLHLKWVRLYSTPASSTAVEKLLCLEVLLLFHAAAVPFSRALNHKKHCHEFLRRFECSDLNVFKTPFFDFLSVKKFHVLFKRFCSFRTLFYILDSCEASRDKLARKKKKLQISRKL